MGCKGSKFRCAMAWERKGLCFALRQARIPEPIKQSLLYGRVTKHMFLLNDDMARFYRLFFSLPRSFKTGDVYSLRLSASDMLDYVDIAQSPLTLRMMQLVDVQNKRTLTFLEMTVCIWHIGILDADHLREFVFDVLMAENDGAHVRICKLAEELESVLGVKLYPDTVSFINNAKEQMGNDMLVTKPQLMYLLSRDPSVMAHLKHVQLRVMSLVASPFVWERLVQRKYVMAAAQQWKDCLRQLLPGMEGKAGSFPVMAGVMKPSNLRPSAIFAAAEFVDTYLSNDADDVVEGHVDLWLPDALQRHKQKEDILKRVAEDAENRKLVAQGKQPKQSERVLTAQDLSKAAIPMKFVTMADGRRNYISPGLLPGVGTQWTHYTGKAKPGEMTSHANLARVREDDDDGDDDDEPEDSDYEYETATESEDAQSPRNAPLPGTVPPPAGHDGPRPDTAASHTAPHRRRATVIHYSRPNDEKKDKFAQLQNVVSNADELKEELKWRRRKDSAVDLQRWRKYGTAKHERFKKPMPWDIF